MKKNSKSEVKVADYLINIDTKDVSLLDIKRISDCYRYGYEQTLSKISEIKEKLQEKI